MPKSSEKPSSDHRTKGDITPKTLFPSGKIPKVPVMFNVYGNAVVGSHAVSLPYVDKDMLDYLSNIMHNMYKINTLYRIKVIPK